MFRYGGFHILNYCYYYKYIIIAKYLILPDSLFKICEKPSKFSESVRVVKDYAGKRFFANFRKYLRENETFRETAFSCPFNIIKFTYSFVRCMLAAPGSLLLKTGSVHFTNVIQTFPTHF